MWIIENPVLTIGGFIKWDTPYRLKHFTTGMYLSVKKIRK